MYKLYIDKSEVFEAKLDITGATYNDSKCRLIIEGDNYSLLFHGTIKSNGQCSIPISKLKRVYAEGDSGKMRLEVIADDTYFVPWETEYLIEVSRKVTAEVIQTKSSAPIIKSVTMSRQKPKSHNTQDLNSVKNIIREFRRNNITLENFHTKHAKFQKIIIDNTTDSSNDKVIISLLGQFLKNQL